MYIYTYSIWSQITESSEKRKNVVTKLWNFIEAISLILNITGCFRKGLLAQPCKSKHLLFESLRFLFDPHISMFWLHQELCFSSQLLALCVWVGNQWRSNVSDRSNEVTAMAGQSQRRRSVTRRRLTWTMTDWFIRILIMAYYNPHISA